MKNNTIKQNGSQHGFEKSALIPFLNTFNYEKVQIGHVPKVEQIVIV